MKIDPALIGDISVGEFRHSASRDGLCQPRFSSAVD
jgi:hypothetical protein